MASSVPPSLSKLIAYKTPESFTLDEKYADPSVIACLASVDPTKPGYQDVADGLYPSEIDKLKRMLKYYKKKTGGNRFSYYQADYRVGRYHIDSDNKNKNCYGLQNVYNVVRRLLMGGMYYDVDMVNAHIYILIDVCKALRVECPSLVKYRDNRGQYLEELQKGFGVSRDVAKKFFIIALYGGDFSTWVHDSKILSAPEPLGFQRQFLAELQTVGCELLKYPWFAPYVNIAENVRRKRGRKILHSAFAYFLQDCEAKVLSVLVRTLQGLGHQIGALIHDGLLVYKTDALSVDRDVLQGLETEVFNVLGLSIALDFKNTAPTPEDLKWYENHKPFMTIDDITVKLQPDQVHCNNILAYMDGKVYRTGDRKKLIMYDDTTGVWCCNEEEHLRIVERRSGKLFTEMGDNKTFCDAFKPAYKLLCAKAPLFSNWVSRKADIGFLCFENGVLDMRALTMLPHDPKYLFTRRINRAFSPEDVDESLEEALLEKIFSKSFTDKVKIDYFLQLLSRACAGYGARVDQMFGVLMGKPKSCKGVMTSLITQALEEFAGTFNAERFTGRSTDVERDFSFLLEIAPCRIAIANEINMATESEKTKYGEKKSLVKLNGNLLKKACGGSDVLKGRYLYKDPEAFINNALILILCNDIPQFQPADAALMRRANYFQFDRSASPDISADTELEFVEDPKIYDFVGDVDVCDAFISLMCKRFQASLQELIPKPEVVTETSRELSGFSEASNWLSDNYDLYQGGLTDFKNERCEWDWSKIGDYCMNRSTLYDRYVREFPGCSTTRFVRDVLSPCGVEVVKRKVRGQCLKYVVGVLHPRQHSLSTVVVDGEEVDE